MTLPIVQTWDNNRKKLPLPELLAIRQSTGKPSYSNVGSLARRGVPFDLLSSRSAWNTKRMQNMILAVGPNTPASLLMGSQPSTELYDSSSEGGDPSSSDEDMHMSQGEDAEEGRRVADSQSIESSDEGEEQAMEEDDVEIEEPSRSRRSRWERNEHEQSESEQDEDGDNEDGQVLLERAFLRYHRGNESESEESGTMDHQNLNPSVIKPVPSLRHGGCINTAAWLNCDWRISTAGASRDAVASEEVPTQLVTSGDDLLVKFWDVSEAMGMSSPLTGSYATICPFSAPHAPEDVTSLRNKWRRYYSETNSDRVAGSVLPLATISTGHLNNVFHVTPLYGQPGKVATCAADGCLRLSDLESGSSAMIVSADNASGVARLRRAVGLRSPMCFSHHFISRNTGLLCSESGLQRFDLRVPPWEQSTRPLLGAPYRGCKACAVWSSSNSSLSAEDGDSAYVFAGGSSAEVVLCDLRMTDDSNSKIVQKYCPRKLSMVDRVSISGLDVSRDGRELLVSYENDQVYTFPVFPNCSSAAGPSVDDIRNLVDRGSKSSLSELACYGAHLNRFTFLKNAKYAGPRDEYICTGSDSGRAWIYEKSSGAVVSYLNADHSTCNGVIPHPVLPFFITYGIDSTAKLWRATTPVDAEVDDSSEGRRQCARMERYEITGVVYGWEAVQKTLKSLDLDEIKDAVGYLLPDQVPNVKDLQYRYARGRLGGMPMPADPIERRLGNDLHNLPRMLSRNFLECIRGIVQDDPPVESGPGALKHRISLIRLRHQADRLGLPWNQSLPWQFTSNENTEHSVHPADLVPDFPSDWIPYDPDMTDVLWDFNKYFNSSEYEAFFSNKYSELMADQNWIPHVGPSDDSSVTEGPSDQQEVPMDGTGEIIVDKEEDPVYDPNNSNVSSKEEPPSKSEMCQNEQRKKVYSIIFETMKLLKDAGNEAVKAGELDLAACRYDKAIRYSALASMSFPCRHLTFANGRKKFLKESGGYNLEWGSLGRTLIVTRLNLALLFLKDHFARYQLAAEQAQLALHDLRPFCAEKGKIMKGKKLDRVHRDNEPEETYYDAKSLEAKALFRLGSAYFEMGEYADAISCYEESISSTEKANLKADNLVRRRLSEAKRESRLARKRQRQKFEFGFEAKASKSREDDSDDA